MIDTSRQWRGEAAAAGIPFHHVEAAARAGYAANWKELPQGRFPPIWENASNEVRDWMRNKSVRSLVAVVGI